MNASVWMYITLGKSAIALVRLHFSDWGTLPHQTILNPVMEECKSKL